MKTMIQEFEGKGSGWSLDKVTSVTLHYYKTRELTTGSYIPLPKELSKKTSLVNPFNPDDDMCIIWCILAKLFPQNKDRDNIELYKPYINQIVNVNSYSYPMALKDIDILEEENNLKINIFHYDRGLLPIRISNRLIVCSDDCKNSIDNYECENCSKRCIDLLNINDEENRSISEHFVLIEKLHVFMNKERQRWICRNCLNECFHRKTDLMKHQELCLDQGSLKCKFPWKSHLSFDKYHHKIDVPFRIYADFETMNVPAYDRRDAVGLKMKSMIRHKRPE